MKKVISLVLAALMLMAVFAGCAKNETPGKTEDKKMSIDVAGLNGGMQTFPIYIAEKNGWFDEENIEVNVVYFENGPVQMEAISSWDLATTGVGGVLSGVIAYDAQLIASPNSDDGTQRIYVRPDSPIVAAGQGNNTLNPEIYGDAESWKGQKVLCTAGNVLQYLLIKTLGGFGLSLEDVDFVSMDTPTANSAFLAGEGDVAVLTGAISLSDDKKDFVMVSSGPLAECGLDCSVVATEDAVQNKHDEIIAFLKAYFRAVEWISNNKDEAVKDLLAFCEETGKDLSEESANIFINAENFYSVADNYKMLNEKAEGSDYCVMEQRILNILEFFISAGNYSEGDDAKFVGHTNNTFINEIYEASK